MGIKMKKMLLFGIPILIIIFIGLLNIIQFTDDKHYLELQEKIISQEFKGVVIDKYSPRKHAESTHLKVLTSDGKQLIISPIQSTLNSIAIGDTIYKAKNENLFYQIKMDIEKRRLEFKYLNVESKKKLKTTNPDFILN